MFLRPLVVIWLGRWALISFVELHEVLLVVICIGDLFGVGDGGFVDA